jgi:hypothetical protein
MKMTDQWIIEMIGSVKDVARSHGMRRLAEQLDDAMLIAASEFHEGRADEADIEVAHDCRDSTPVRGPSATGVH